MKRQVKVYFNFRSPYCYLASRSMWPIFEQFDVEMAWRPVGGWDLRSPPDRAAAKVPLARQDVARWARRLGIPFNPPPAETDPTPAGAASLLAERRGRLRELIVEIMWAEWAEGRNIGDSGLILEVGAKIGLDGAELAAAITDPANVRQLAANAREAASDGVIGVPSFVIGEAIFWGQDRIEFVMDHLRESL